jgi:hypothetical protein
VVEFDLPEGCVASVELRYDVVASALTRDLPVTATNHDKEGTDP